MLIKNAEIAIGDIVDVRIDGGVIRTVNRNLQAEARETIVDAAGASVLPALHDHHIHMFALARAMDSVPCGPPHVQDGPELVSVLRQSEPTDGWIRGIGYHESVAGDIDRDWIDHAIPELSDAPVRIQHRTGRLWIFNSAGLRAISAFEGETPLEVAAGRFTGRLYDADVWMRARLPAHQISLAAASRTLAKHGVAGVTDATPGNGPEELRLFQAALQNGELLQDVVLMGGFDFDHKQTAPELRIGPVKFHLYEAELPPLEEAIAQVHAARRQGRNVAFHCVTLVDLAFVMAVLQGAGSRQGDRIEHASVTPDTFLGELARLGVTIVTQPHFVWERGDVYHREIKGAERSWLYRARSFLRSRIPLAAGSDAPFGTENPWISMASATKRTTRGGLAIGRNESLTPDDALRMYLGDAGAPGGPSRRISEGGPATLCLLDRSWAAAREALEEVNVRLTLRRGSELWQA
jgi:predicted amidohydrolase YtcJ